MSDILLNQMNQTSAKGKLEQTANENIFNCQISSSYEGSALVPAQAVTLVTTSSRVPVVQPATDGDKIFGFVMLNHKANSRYLANDQIRIASDYSVMTMEASGAVARGDFVEYVVEGQKVTVTGEKANAIGVALDNGADGGLLRVLIKCIDSVVYQAFVPEAGDVARLIADEVGSASTGDVVKLATAVTSGNIAVTTAGASDTYFGVLQSDNTVITSGAVYLLAGADLTAGTSVTWNGSEVVAVTDEEPVLGTVVADAEDEALAIVLLSL